MKKLEQSKFNKWVNNSLTFLAPLAILYLITIQERITSDGFQLSDLQFDNTMAGAGSLYIINVALDFFKKYKQ